MYKTLFTGVCSILAFTACTNEDFGHLVGKKDTGVACLNIDIKNPSTRAISEVSNFPVIIYNEKGEVIESYDKVTNIPEKVILPVGNYFVTSHTPGEIEKTMDKPFYNGTETMEIMKDVTSPVEVVCKMQNSKIQVNYDDDFKSTFSTWEITVSDNDNTNYPFTHDLPTQSIYLYFGEKGAKELIVNFRGTTTNGTTISSRNVLTKNQADESYDDDHENFAGGDLLNLNFTPTESTDGIISGITITADVTFTEDNTNITVDVIDKPGFEDEGGGSTEEPIDPTPGDDNVITLNLPSDMTVSSDTDPALGDTYIKADNGLKSIKVKVSSTSEDMLSSLQALSAGYGVDFIAGAEVVQNQQLVNLFTKLGQPLTVPNEGDTEYTFPIGNFFGMLVILPGDHTFDLIITDMNGNTKSGKLVLTVEQQ